VLEKLAENEKINNKKTKFFNLIIRFLMFLN
jgi:hypothetical protein